MSKTIADARQLYLEQYGSTMVMNTYLKLVLVLVTLALLGALVLSFSVYRWARNQKPMVVRIDEVGRATAVNYTGFEYRPEAPELRYFLAQFVQLHFSRMLGSADERFGKSLYFLDAKLSQAVIEDERKSESLKAFVREGHEEIDIEIKNVILQDLRSTPMKASVDFQKVYFPRGERRELRRERYAASFEFEVQETVPSNFVLVNPLGLTITYFRVDEAFKP
jgi:type IV secretory pathway TrbF-like protein